MDGGREFLSVSALKEASVSSAIFIYYES